MNSSILKVALGVFLGGIALVIVYMTVNNNIRLNAVIDQSNSIANFISKNTAPEAPATTPNQK